MVKIETDKHGRRIYKFSHSVAQGGYLYAQKTANVIENKEGLRNALHAIAKKYGFIDFTIKVYDHIFFLFFMTNKSTIPQDIVDSVQRNIIHFSV